MVNEWTHIDLFSGANAFRMGFEAGGFNITRHLFSEIDNHAIANTRYNYPESEYIGSVTDVSGLRTDGRTIITFGWPCQDNSIAGKRKGHAAGTRSGLLFEAVRLIDEARPELFTAENVEGLRTVNKGIDIVEAIKFLAFLNESLPQYDVEMQLLNTRWFLPQNRERLYFVGHLRNGSSRQVFPIGETTGLHPEKPRQAFVANCLDASYAKGWLDKGQRTHVVQIRSATASGYELATEGDSINLTFPDSKTRRGRVGKGMSQTLDTSCNQGILLGGEIRRFTPIETERLQGWPDNHTLYGNYDGVVKQISDTQRYRLCGNGVSVPCVKAVADKLNTLYNANSLTKAA